MKDSPELFITEKRGTCTIIHIKKPLLLEEDIIASLQQKVRSAFNDEESDLIVMDFTPVLYVNGSILTLLWDWDKLSNDHNKPIRFCSIPDDIYEDIQIAHLRRKYCNFKNIDAAIENQQ